MKLLLCTNCIDVIKLDFEERKCKCGNVKGRYKDAIQAVYSGEGAVKIGFNNHSLIANLCIVNESEEGTPFEAFLIPDSCETFVEET